MEAETRVKEEVGSALWEVVVEAETRVKKEVGSALWEVVVAATEAEMKAEEVETEVVEKGAEEGEMEVIREVAEENPLKEEAPQLTFPQLVH